MLIRDSYTIECLMPYLPDGVDARPGGPRDIDLNNLIGIAAASPAAAESITACLKMGVEHSADSDPDIARALADAIIAIGERRKDSSLIGLGLLAHGDIFAHTGQNYQAWDTLERAGSVYLDAGDSVGWARTRVNRLYVSAELSASSSNYVRRAFADAARAEQILIDADRHDRLLRLYHAWAYACVLMGRYEDAIAYYQRSIATIQRLNGGQNTPIMIAGVYADLGAAYNALGEFQTAMTYLTDARRVFLESGHATSAAIAGAGMAVNYTIRGHFRPAMHLLLNSVLPNLRDHRADAARLTLIECLLALNREREAHAVGQKLVAESIGDPDRYHLTAMAALLLAAVQARVGEFEQAQQSLELAETNFRPFEGMVAQVQLRRAQVALRQGDLAVARAMAEEVAAAFRRWQQLTNWIEATLVCAEAALLAGDLADAERNSMLALRNARGAGLEPVSYRAYTVLAQVLERQGRRHSTIRACRAALAVLERMKRALTLSLRAGFMEDKLQPFHRLMALYLADGRIDYAFETLERLKAQVFVDYLADRERLQWNEDEHSQPLLEELTRQRDKYRWLNRLQTMPPAEETEAHEWYGGTDAYANLLQAAAACEADIRKISEQLALQVEPTADSTAEVVQIWDIQSRLDAQTLLVAYYFGPERAWCIGITAEQTFCEMLPISAAELEQLIADKLQSNIDFALNVGPQDPRSPVLLEKAQRIGEKLYHLLLEPLAAVLDNTNRLMIVPYGILHQLPFNLLRRGSTWLIETHEVVTLPAAGLLCRPPVRCSPGALVLAHSWGGRLSLSADEGQAVHKAMGGRLCLEDAASRTALTQAPCQVLHVSAHGEHRIDQPDFSYIELADGPVYADDLLQCDLSYELVVLSACEIGRSNITAGEEMIGLGRGFLYAGAGALITSLWRVDEAQTFHLMQSFYRALCVGESKAHGLQMAQRELLARDPALHPAFWAAFQLVCNPDPLSIA